MIHPHELTHLGFAPYNVNTSDFYTTYRKYVGLLIVEVTTDLEQGLQTVEIGIGDSWHRCHRIDTHNKLETLLLILE
jgi:hypothetical protein